jgi:hypothetical protein
MTRSKPYLDWKAEKQRLEAAAVRRRKRWTHDTPSGTSVRQLRRAVLAGYSKPVRVRDPAAYLNSSPAKSAYVWRRNAELAAKRSAKRAARAALKTA